MNPLILMFAFLFLTTPVFAQPGGLPEKDPFDPTCRWDSAARPYKEPNQQRADRSREHGAHQNSDTRRSAETPCKPNDQLCAADQFHVDWTGTGFEEVLAVIENFSSPVNKQTCECDRSPCPAFRAQPDPDVREACIVLMQANGIPFPFSREMLDRIAAQCGPIPDNVPNNVKLACMALTSHDRTVPASQEDINLIMEKSWDRIRNATIAGMNKPNAIMSGAVLRACERAYLTSGHRSKDHENERHKPKPGSHSIVEKSPTDFAAVSTNGAPTYPPNNPT